MSLVEDDKEVKELTLLVPGMGSWSSPIVVVDLTDVAFPMMNRSNVF
jgi:hypothetical protein